jgi:hypothetical protein
MDIHIHGCPWISMDIHETGLLSYTMKGITESHLHTIKDKLNRIYIAMKDHTGSIYIYIYIYNKISYTFVHTQKTNIYIYIYIYIYIDCD